MSVHPPTDKAVRPSRPVSVERAVYALIARCVFGLLVAVAFFGDRADVPVLATWSPASLPGHIDEYLKAYLISNIAYVVMVLVLAKFIWDGRNWARWVYLEFAFFIPGDVLRVFGVFTFHHSVLMRLLSGLAGIAAIAALTLLFLPASSNYLRRPGSKPALAGLMTPMLGRAVARSAARTGRVSAAGPPLAPAVGEARAAPQAPGTAQPPGVPPAPGRAESNADRSGRPSQRNPRAKSRRTPAE